MGVALGAGGGEPGRGGRTRWRRWSSEAADGAGKNGHTPSSRQDQWCEDKCVSTWEKRGAHVAVSAWRQRHGDNGKMGDKNMGTTTRAGRRHEKSEKTKTS